MHLRIKKRTFASVMERIFHQQFTMANKCGITLFSLLACYLFWHKAALPGMFVAVIVVLMIERMIHTTYTFTASDRGEVLRINRGRFSKPMTIAVDEIIRCTRMKTAFGLSHYLLIEYGARRIMSVTPDNSEAFIAELKKRQEQNEK